jgi:hypothetical protein
MMSKLSFQKCWPLILALAATWVIACSLQAFAGSTSSNAATWLAMSEAEKLSTVKTAIYAYETGWNDGYTTRGMQDEPSDKAAHEAYENKYVGEMQGAIPSFSRPLSDYVAAITADCVKTGCHFGYMWILPCMADKVTISHGLKCHSNVPKATGK